MILKEDFFFPKVKYLYNFDKTITIDNKLGLEIDGFDKDEILNLLSIKLDKACFKYDIKFRKFRFLITSNLNNVKTWDNNYKMLLNEQSYYISLMSNFLLIYSKTVDGIKNSLIILNKIVKNNTLNSFEIIDYPDIKKRGLVEGFYGYPYKFKDRINLIKDLSNYKFNYYIYAPKNDIYHRSLWHKLYPIRKLEKIKELASLSSKYYINFVWTIHPGDTIDFESKTDFKKAISKLYQLYKIGVRNFGIFFDDITKNIDAIKQANFINMVDKEFIKKNNLPPLLVVGTRYCLAWGPDIESYFKVFLDKLNKGIEVLWTGENTISYVKDEYFNFKKLFNKDVKSSVWLNYPVNDYCNGKLLISKIPYLYNDLSNQEGFYINPMRHINMSKISLYNISSYMWNIKGYDFLKSWEKACKRLFKNNYKYFKGFLDNVSYLNHEIKNGKYFFLDESSLIKDDIKNLKDNLDKNKNLKEIIKKLENKFLGYLSDIKMIKKTSSKDLLKEIKVFLKAYYYLTRSFLFIFAYLKNKEVKFKKRASYFLNLANKLHLYDLKEDDNKIARRKRFNVEFGEMLIKPTILEILQKY